MRTVRRLGPMDGHWAATLSLIEVAESSLSAICLICISAGKPKNRSTICCYHNASNLYTHMKSLHPDVYEVLRSIINSREKNMRARTQYTTITDLVARSKQRSVDESLLCLFSSPDIPKHPVESQRFLQLVRSLNSQVIIPTRKTLDSRLWDKFSETLRTIRDSISQSDFVVLTFDGWSTHRCDYVMGFMVSSMKKDFTLQTRCVANFKMTEGPAAPDVCKAIARVVRERLGGRVPNYYVSDSAPVNKLVVRKYMNDRGDEFWFPCAVHFAQLSMREAVLKFLTGKRCESFEGHPDFETLTEEEMLQFVRESFDKGAIDRLVTTCRDFRSCIRKSHNYASRFAKHQLSLGATVTIISDVRIRFDSTLDMFETIVRDKHVLLGIQEYERRDNSVWPETLHLSRQDFSLMDSIVGILGPVRVITKSLSFLNAWIGDVLPLFTSAVDTIQRMEVDSSAIHLKQYLVEALIARVKMLLGTDYPLPYDGGNPLSTLIPTEFVAAAYLNPKFSGAIDAFYGFSEHLVAVELSRLYQERFDDENTTELYSGSSISVTVFDCTNSDFTVDAWKERVLRNAPLHGRTRSSNSQIICRELTAYRAEISIRQFTACESRRFWMKAQQNGKFPRLGKLARLLMSVPESAIPQERQFSELKSRCAGLRSRAKVETMDRDSVIYGWMESDEMD